MTNVCRVRLFANTDVGQLAKVFHLSINQGAASHYSTVERAVWSPALRSDDDWQLRLAPTVTWVAEIGQVISGFINLKSAEARASHDAGLVLSAEIDCLFTHPDFAGKGVASQLYQQLEEYALTQKIAELTVEASYLAKIFFEKKGFQVLSKNDNQRSGQVLVNFSMRKMLK